MTPAPPSSSVGARDCPRAREWSWPSRALYEAADEDSATGGPDLVRGIYPLVAAVDTEGFREIPESEVAERFSSLVDRRRLGVASGSGSGSEVASS